jgi:hypothetical protein
MIDAEEAFTEQLEKLPIGGFGRENPEELVALGNEGAEGTYGGHADTPILMRNS